MKSISKMVKVEAKCGKRRQNVTSERIESGSKNAENRSTMRKLNLKNFIIPNPYLEMWNQNVERESKVWKVEAK